MGLQIIGAGFGRTGTMSTQSALNQIGYNCYHMKELAEKANKSHIDFWYNMVKKPKKSKQDWDKIFKNYTATVDFPSSCVWQDLVKAYPEAKVILTLHPKGPEAWYKSTNDTIYSFSKRWEFKVMALFNPKVRKLAQMAKYLIWKDFLNGTMESKQEAINRYIEHIEEVKKQVPTDKLLIFSADQGWKPLCHFLGKEAPHSPFPKVNEKSEIQKRFKYMSTFARLIVAMIIVVGIVITWMIV